MSGWKRLFTVFAVCVCTLSGAAWWLNKPDGLQGSRLAMGCLDAFNTSYFTPAEAGIAYLTLSDKSTQCAKDLRKISSGDAYREDRSRWWSTLNEGARVVLAFLFIVYGLGWAIGWIWRGFFPKRTV